MAWEKRRKGSYYYRKIWRDGTCHSEYIGKGLMGQVAQGRDRRHRQERQVATVATPVATQQMAVMRQVDELSDLVGALLGSHLLLAGYHQHKRQWRKQRAQTTE